MTKAEELFAHAERCRSLAESSIDRTVAEKLRRLAQDYLTQAAQLRDRRGQSAGTRALSAVAKNPEA